MLLASTLAVAGARDDPEPLTIHVSGITGLRTIEKEERKTLNEELRTKSHEAFQAALSFFSQMRKQYGEEQEQWPRKS